MKATLNDVTTAYLGNYYEQSGSAYKKYYYAGGTRIAMSDNGTVKYLLGDHLGSTSLVASSSGGLITEQRYKPWGENRYTNGTTPTRYQFTGQRNDVEIGLYFYNARFYSSVLGRFISADTIVPDGKNPQAFNRYAYVNNNPLKYVDPSGHAWQDIITGGGSLGGLYGGGGSAGEGAAYVYGVLLFPLTVAVEAVDTVASGVQCAGGDGWACVGAAVPFLSGAAAKGLGKVLGLVNDVPMGVADEVVESLADAGKVADNTTDLTTKAEKIELHHSDPKFLGGAPDQPLTPLSQSTHGRLHKDLNQFLKSKVDDFGNDMMPRRNNSGAKIQMNFSLQERRTALAEFYTLYGDKYSDAARDYFRQHPELEP